MFAFDDKDAALIPPPSVVREKLANNVREGRLLRSLLALSIKAAVEKQGREAKVPASQRVMV